MMRFVARLHIAERLAQVVLVFLLDLAVALELSWPDGWILDEIIHGIAAAVIEQVEDHILVEVEFGRGGALAFEHARAERIGQLLGALDEAHDVGALLVGVGVDAPDDVLLDELGAEGLALVFDALGKELVAVGELRERLGEAAFTVRKDSHTVLHQCELLPCDNRAGGCASKIVGGMYTECTSASGEKTLHSARLTSSLAETYDLLIRGHTPRYEMVVANKESGMLKRTCLRERIRSWLAAVRAMMQYLSAPATVAIAVGGLATTWYLAVEFFGRNISQVALLP